ncbi:hypothetical protein B9N43_02510 [Denitratisoma sp. DHT3]|uniref:antibiotic biosynthesis monooxygenase n=1 Tax=Denitratisoma sp. DHT3 TaxID=1981880 RepID=UPI001198360D|nr:antibiotic biosynthesis monooxygenase [Denitratisoma sp. DHT3]QDX80231.1 hypothetical protein B9N43_02510 [Denitratisoma sp. DHT3]
MTSDSEPFLRVPGDKHEQVFFVVRHRVRAGAREAYERWLRHIMQVAAKFPGHLGVQIVRPPAGRQEYVMAVRFQSQEDAARWHRSADREALIAQLENLLDSDEQIDIVSGIDYWFTPPSGIIPPRWKQLLATTAVIWPLTVLISVLLAPLQEALPRPLPGWLLQGLNILTVVALATYLVMPRWTRLLAKWLYRR